MLSDVEESSIGLSTNLNLCADVSGDGQEDKIENTEGYKYLMAIQRTFARVVSSKMG